MNNMTIQATNPQENKACMAFIDADTYITFGQDEQGQYSEVYTGSNYVPCSSKRSYSRIYRETPEKNVEHVAPKKYINIIRQLRTFSNSL